VTPDVGKIGKKGGHSLRAQKLLDNDKIEWVAIKRRFP
jgi:hypothetical protein